MRRLACALLLLMASGLLPAPLPAGATAQAEGRAQTESEAQTESGARAQSGAQSGSAARPGSGGFRHREKSPDAPPLPKIEFYCTDSKGARRELGALLCIRTGCREVLARCEMALNNPIWRELQEGCPAAALSPIPQPPPTRHAP